MDKRQYNKAFYCRILLVLFLTFPLWYYLYIYNTGAFSSKIPIRSLRPADRVTSLEFHSDSIEIEITNRGGIFFRTSELPDKAAGLRLQTGTFRSQNTGEKIRTLGGKLELTLLYSNRENQHRISSTRSAIIHNNRSFTVYFPFPREEIQKADEIFVTFSPNIQHVPLVWEITGVEALAPSVNIYFLGNIAEQGRYRIEAHLQEIFPWVSLENTGFWNVAGLFLCIAMLFLLPWKKIAHHVRMVFVVVLFFYLFFLGLESLHSVRALHYERNRIHLEAKIQSKSPFESSMLMMLYGSPYQLDASLAQLVVFLNEIQDKPPLHLYKGTVIERYFLGTLLTGITLHYSGDLRFISPGDWVILSYQEALKQKNFLDEHYIMLKRIDKFLVYKRI